jgi:hypothetical protein
MSDFQSEMNRTVQGFVAQISELARRAAIDTLESAFAGRATTRSSTAASVAIAAVPASNGERAERTRGGRPRVGAKRTSADLVALSDRFASFVKANPGLRIEQINKELGTVTKDLALPIRKLLADGVITSKGQKRSTTYFAGKKSAKN